MATILPAAKRKVPRATGERLLWSTCAECRFQNKRTSIRINEQLSGGQQQWAAIARTLCREPRILLLDEPTSALDPEMINEVLDVLIDVAQEGRTMLCVTHEMSFARRVADRVIVMDRGCILEEAPPERFFTNPQHERTRQFLSSVLPITANDRARQIRRLASVRG